MTTEVAFLNYILLFGFILAPLLMNKFILNNSPWYSYAHIGSLILVSVGLVLNLSFITYVWPLFCIFGSVLYLNVARKSIFTFVGVAQGLPFAFSLISSLWFVAAQNDLRLLGYDKVWSMYAALHGCFLGWIFVGCLAFLSKKNSYGKLNFFACYLSFILFLSVAFGIDGAPYLKRIGVIGFSVLVPIMIWLFALTLTKQNLRSLIFSWISLGAIIVSMGLALLNEFWIDFPRVSFGLSTMVWSHGILNALVVLPSFALAIIFAEKHNNIKD